MNSVHPPDYANAVAILVHGTSVSRELSVLERQVQAAFEKV